jgi:hypothetical protein
MSIQAGSSAWRCSRPHRKLSGWKSTLRLFSKTHVPTIEQFVPDISTAFAVGAARPIKRVRIAAADKNLFIS